MGEEPRTWSGGFDGPLGEFPEWHQVLTSEIVPASDAPFYPDISEFALTLDGYEVFGGVGPLGDVANRVASEWTRTGVLPDDLVALRSCLFFEQRRYRHFGEGPGEADMPYIRALVDAIRTYASGGSEDWEERLDKMLVEWIEVEREIAGRKKAFAEQVAFVWRDAFELMTDEYLDLVAQGLWRRGPADLFNVIGIGRNEVRHSAIVAWLLDPLARHGFGPALMRSVLRSCFPNDVSDLSGAMTIDTEVARGDTRADIVVWGGDFTLVIEVKVDAGEGERQCDRLYEHFDDDPGAVFVFLTPTGRKPETATGDAAKAFRTLSFPQMRGFLEEAIGASDATHPDLGRSTALNYFRTLEKEFR